MQKAVKKSRLFKKSRTHRIKSPKIMKNETQLQTCYLCGTISKDDKKNRSKKGHAQVVYIFWFVSTPILKGSVRAHDMKNPSRCTALSCDV